MVLVSCEHVCVIPNYSTVQNFSLQTDRLVLMSFLKGHITGPLKLTARYWATQQQMLSLILVYSLTTNSKIPIMVTFQPQTLSFLLGLFASNNCGFAFRSESCLFGKLHRLKLFCRCLVWFGWLVGGFTELTNFKVTQNQRHIDPFTS